MAASPPVGRSWHLNGWQTLLFALAALAIVSGAWFAWREARRAATSVGWVQHTFSVLIESDQLLAALSDAEVGQRGYLLTGDVSYLQPYDQALPRVVPRFEALRRATADVPSAQARLAEIEPLVREKLDELTETIRRARSGEPEAALALVRSGAGKELMDEIRRGIAEIRTQEQELLRQRIAARDTYLRGTRSYALILGGLSLGVFGVLIASINRTMGARRAAERGARESEQRLRVTLESIGDAVIATDVVGRVVFMNPVAEALTGWRRAEAQELPLDQVFRIVNEVTRDVVESPVAKVMREGGVVGLANHTVLIARDGTERPIDDSGAPIRDGDGELMGVVLVFRDVDARRRRSEQARERLLRAEAERDDRGAARTARRTSSWRSCRTSCARRSPPRSRWVELLDGATRSARAERARALDTIERNLRHQSVLVSDLLDVSRIVAGKLSARARADRRRDARARRSERSSRARRCRRGCAAPRGVAAARRAGRPRADPAGDLEPALERDPLHAGRRPASTSRSPADDGARRDPRARHRPRHPCAAAAARVRALPAGAGSRAGARARRPRARPRDRAASGGAARRHDRGAERRRGSRRDLPGAPAAPASRRRRRRRERHARGAAPKPADGRLRGATVLLVEDHVDTRDALEHLLRLHGARVLCASSAAEALALVRNRATRRSS